MSTRPSRELGVKSSSIIDAANTLHFENRKSMGTAGTTLYPASERARSKLRGNPRASCNIPAELHFQGVSLCSGIIKDISVAGARLFVPDKISLPQEFEITAEVFDHPIKVCTRWSEKEYVGVRFLLDQD